MERNPVDGLLELGAALEALSPFAGMAEAGIMTAMAVFVRIGAIIFMLPGFGDRQIGIRVKLAAALAFAVVAWPMVLPTAPAWAASGAAIGVVYAAEAANGLLLGLMTRMLVFALQTAGSLAAQSLSISQMFGAGIAPDPEPTITTLLSMAGVALAMALGLHVKAAALIVESYDALPLGRFPLSEDAITLVVSRVSESFGFALSLALPFVVISFVYNLALGFINKAMPQLMVTFVGLPAITWIGILLLGLTASAVVTHWHSRFDAVIASPLGV